MENLHIVPSIFSEQHRALRLVLIQSGVGDEAICYHAPVGIMLDSQSFLVYFHPTSLILERVRLFGPIAVLAEFEPQSKFLAELSLKNLTLDASEQERCSLILKLLSRKESDCVFEQRICPMT